MRTGPDDRHRVGRQQPTSRHCFQPREQPLDALCATIPDALRGRVFTLLDVTRNAARLPSLALGALVVDAVGVRPVFWLGGTLLALSGLLGLALLGGHDVRGTSDGR